MPDPLSRIITWAALLIAAALFVMARAAVQAADTTTFDKMALAKGGRWAKQVLRVIEQPTLFTLAADLWALLIAAFILTDVPVFFFNPLDSAARPVIALAVAGTALALYLLAGLIPRRIGEKRPYAVLRALFWPAWALSLPLWPLCWALDKIALPGLAPGPETVENSEEEILDMVDRGGESGTIDAAEKEMIENIFQLNNLDAEDIMVHRTDMVVVWEEDTEAEILETIRSSGLSRFPLCREDVDDVIGVLSTRDYLLNYRLDEPRPLAELLRPAYFVPETVRADALLREMQRQKVHMAIVVDEYGGTSGLLTMEDLLEQLVGDIYDEFDSEEEQAIVPLGDNLWRIRGSTDLEAVAEALGVDIPESEEYDTLGGLIFSGLTVIPDDGSHPVVTACGLRMTVEQLADRRVEWAAVEKLPDSEDAPSES